METKTLFLWIEKEVKKKHSCSVYEKNIFVYSSDILWCYIAKEDSIKDNIFYDLLLRLKMNP